jgi:hypothetical protein
VNDDVYITVSLEADNDQPVADIAYRGVQWASLRFEDGVEILTVFAADDGFELPAATALASLDEARRRLT